MKNSIKMTASAFLLALVFSFAGCQNGLDADAANPATEASAKIVVNIGGTEGAARTLGPSADNLSYRLVVTSGFTKLEADVTGSTITQELEAGTWTVGVWAYTGDELGVGWASKSVQLAEGETKDVYLVVQPLADEEAAGTFSWETTLPLLGSDEYTYLNATLTPSSPNSSANPINLYYFSEHDEDWATFTGSLDLPAGKYTLDITAYSNRKINNNQIKAVRKEIVYIYPHLTTNAAVAFTATDFSAQVYFSGTASIYYATGASGYTPAEVELLLADGTYQTAPITVNEDEQYEWELSAASNAIAINLASAQIRFKATATTGGKSFYSKWQTVSLPNATGNNNITLSADVYKVTVARFTGGAITVNPEAAAGGLTRLTLAPAANYGVDASALLAAGMLPVEGSNGLQYDFEMPAFDLTIAPASGNDFFQLKGTIAFTGANTAGYRPVKIEAKEVGEDYAWKAIAETTSFDTAANKYAWTINPLSYVYTNDGSTTNDDRWIAFKVTLESADGSITYSYTLTTDIDNLYGQGEAAVDIAINTLTGLYTTIVSDTSIKLVWDQAGWAANGFNVYRSTDNVNYTKVNTAAPVKATDYTDENLTAATGYFYYVKGILANGTEGEASYVGYETKTKYPAPASVTASFSGGYPLQNYVSWAPVSAGQYGNVRYYKVYRNDELIVTTSNTYYNDNNGVEFDTRYTYAVVATGSDGNDSAATSSAAFSTAQLTDISLGTPTSRYVTNGEYQYFQIKAAQDFYACYFNYDTQADIYVQVRTSSSLLISQSLNSGTTSNNTIYNQYSPLIVVIRGNGSEGNAEFSVEGNW